jgi:hypothetical protein
VDTTTDSQTDLGTDVGQEPETVTGPETGVGTEPNTGTGIEVGPGTDVEPESGTGTEPETRVGQEPDSIVETEPDAEPETESRTESRQRTETLLGVEIGRQLTETGLESEPSDFRRRERSPGVDDDDGELFDDRRASPEETDSVLGNALSAGFLNEFTAQLAGVDRSSPSESDLEDVASDRVTTEALPTEGELEESEEFGQAAGFLGGEGTGFEFGFSDGDEDGGFNLL